MATQWQPRDAKLEDVPGMVRTDLSAFEGNAQREQTLKKDGPEKTKMRLSDKYARYISNPQRFKTTVIELDGVIISIGVMDLKPLEEGITSPTKDGQYYQYNDVFLTYFAKYEERFAMIRTLATHQDNQRQGCGKAIFESLKAEAGLGEGRVITVYSSAKGQAFYEKEGFELAGSCGEEPKVATGYILHGYN